MNRTFAVVAVAALCAACSTKPAADDPAAHKAHDAYVTAINSNNLDTLLGVLADDVVFRAPVRKAPVAKKAPAPKRHVAPRD
jgi:hypothetical protein